MIRKNKTDQEKRKLCVLLDRIIDELKPLEIEDRHDAIVALMAWHVMSCPEGIVERMLDCMPKQAFALLKAAKGRAPSASSDLRH